MMEDNESGRLSDIICQYMQARKRNGIVSTSEAARTISMVVSIDGFTPDELDDMIARAAIEQGLLVRFDRRGAKAMPPECDISL